MRNKIRTVLKNTCNNVIETNKYYYLSFCVPLLLILIYGTYRCSHKEYKDPLEMTIGIKGLDGWSLTHVMFFMIMGYLFPNTLIQTMILGMIWESFEHISGTNRPGWLGGYGGDCNGMKSKNGGNWWYGKWSDILCNLFGFMLGMNLSKNYFYIILFIYILFFIFLPTTLFFLKKTF
jgi:hypothetical protein